MLHICRATNNDGNFFLALRNEEGVRLASWNTDPIDPETHAKWFLSSLLDPARIIYIVEHEGIAVGQMRFDIFEEGKEAEVNIAISERFCGRGFGQEGLRAGGEKFLNEFPAVAIIHAYIKSNNVPSIKIFEKVGYQRTEEAEYKGYPCIGMVYNRHSPADT